MSFLEDMYKQIILEHYRSPRNRGRLEAPTVAQAGHNPSCGDELELHVAPLVLGGGARLFDGVGPDLRLEQVRVIEAPGVTHVKYRVLT